MIHETVRLVAGGFDSIMFSRITGGNLNDMPNDFQKGLRLNTPKSLFSRLPIDREITPIKYNRVR